MKLNLQVYSRILTMGVQIFLAGTVLVMIIGMQHIPLTCKSCLWIVYWVSLEILGNFPHLLSSSLVLKPTWLDGWHLRLLKQTQGLLPGAKVCSVKTGSCLYRFDSRVLLVDAIACEADCIPTLSSG